MSDFDDQPPGRKAKSGKRAAPQGHLLALEPRMMFDGAAVATAAATVTAPDIANPVPHDVMSGLETGNMAAAPADFAARAAHGVPRGGDGYEPSATGEARWSLPDNSHGWARMSEHLEQAPVLESYGGARDADVPPASIIFIDTAVENHAALASEWSGRGEIILIDASRDGIDQMMAALAGRSGLESIHIVSHGTANRFMLGTTNIDAGAVTGELGEAWAAIGAKLAADGDILIYGCDVGTDDMGQSFIDAIAARSGADVAASSDLTGAAALGGDWDLESRSGQVEAQALVSERYAGLLQLTNPPGAWTIAGNSASNTIDGVTVTITFTGTNAFSALTNDTLNNIAAFANGAQTTPDVSTVFNNAAAAGITGTITITFSEAVTNPIINIDRLGGVAGTGLSNTATLTLATAGATLTKLTGPSHLVVGSTTIAR